jgi:hypothetical protein
MTDTGDAKKRFIDDENVCGGKRIRDDDDGTNSSFEWNNTVPTSVLVSNVSFYHEHTHNSTY